ncbi:phenylalanine ammonia-lyase [Pseudovirgaria hyperparasitica]|uniref:Phenylalanine ammonia-lyase n=1 Tax=Pseudovirgaria hyperparasitica TaxID=470096 RepID=A0A6A6VRV7_9PEZI|nr:phenylalanine ammonia-lyase [Pseudovirgaria hyperparasitica]KAF2753418.1 phenylalanine ammonia-lyase [Pseudovirgaria hyperparasitica]
MRVAEMFPPLLIAQGELSIDGRSLDIASVVAVSRHRCTPTIDKRPDVLAQVNESVETLMSYLSDGAYLYGVNTGFGGSADVRTTDLLALQRALIQHTTSAVVTESDIAGKIHDEYGSNVMPSVWMKAAMLIRANTNIRGHSAVSMPVAERVIQLIQNDCTPLVPLRGSVSASGDLMPMSYVASAIMGCPDTHVRMGSAYGGLTTSADDALRRLNLEPVILGPKEGLGLINGTAASAAVASLAVYEANNLAVVSQVLTAMASESLAANVEWTHPFIADVRPHSGQIEAACNFRSFLAGSKLVVGLSGDKDRFKTGLAQERYALRSAPQWMSPVLEDLLSASVQITTELNSTSDNPIVDSERSEIYSGANFQAAAVTLASEKTRSCLQMLGKLVFAQATEIINNTLNNGLPPNLAADDPSLSFCLKGIDVNMAAYQSELGFLANPVSSHVQSAEMHNQAINSLALLTSRYTMQAVEVMQLMCASMFYTTCQALDLRVLHASFLASFNTSLRGLITQTPALADAVSNELHAELVKTLAATWYASATLDARERCDATAAALVPVLTAHLASQACPVSLSDTQRFREELGAALLARYVSHRDAFFSAPTTAAYLGKASKACYEFVRGVLGVPLHRGLVEHPGVFDVDQNVIDGRKKRTIGSWVALIHGAVRDGRLMVSLWDLRRVHPRPMVALYQRALRAHHMMLE